MSSTLFNQLNQIYSGLPDQTRAAITTGEGLGSWEANLQAMVDSLERRGVQSLSDLAVAPRPILEQRQFRLDKNGNLQRIVSNNEVNEFVPVSESERRALEQTPEFAKAIKDFEADRFGEMDAATFNADAPSGRLTGTLYNVRTGDIIDDNKDDSPLEAGFYIDQTKAGKGKTHFNLYPVPKFNEQGGIASVSFIPGTEYRATGIRNFLNEAAPLLGMAGFALGLPGVAAGLGTAGTVASTVIRGLGALNAFDQGNVLAGIAGLAGMAPGVNQIGNLGLSADALSGIKTAGNVAGLAGAVQNKDIIGALSRASQIPQIASLMPGEIAGIPTGTIMQGGNVAAKALQGDYLSAVIGALDMAGQKTIPGTDILLEDAKKVVGIVGGGAKSTGAGGAGAATDQVAALGGGLGGGLGGAAGLAALYGAASTANSIGEKQREAADERKRQSEMEAAQQRGYEMFGGKPFAGGGMVKRFSSGGFSDEDLWFFDNSDLVFDSLPIVTGVGPGDRFGNLGIGSISSSDIRAATQPSQSQLQSIWNSLGSAAKALFMTDGKVDWTKLGSIAGGLYGYNQAKDFDMSGVGFQGTIPQLASARAQVPYQHDAERRPGSFGRRYLSDMYYAKPEDTLKIQQQALEQAQGLAALQRPDGSMSTAIAPGGITPRPLDLPPEWGSYLQQERGAQKPPKPPSIESFLPVGLNRGPLEDKIAAYNSALATGYTDAEIRAAADERFGAQTDSDWAALTRYARAHSTPLTFSQSLSGGAMEDKLSAYRDAVNFGFSDAQIRSAAETQFGAQTDSDWAYLRQASGGIQGLAKGGIATLAKGGPAREPRYLDGPTNGQSDKIQTTIDGEQPALLSHGEFVVPADVVGALGGGNSKAGASALYEMMDRVRQQAFGRKKQMTQVKPGTVLPA